LRAYQQLVRSELAGELVLPAAQEALRLIATKRRDEIVAVGERKSPPPPGTVAADVFARFRLKDPKGD
jgi:hypothetical protein